jgi:phosphonate transport system substrate-binding protein
MRLRNIVILVFLFVVSFPCSAETPLNLGIFPYLNAHKLYRIYMPIKRELEQTLGRPVLLQTAPSYRSFLERTAAGEYDIVVTPPHFALLAEQESNYSRLARARPVLESVIVVSRDGPIREVADLRGRKVATPDPMAIVTLLGEELFQTAGINPQEDLILKATTDVKSSILRLSRGQADAAISVAGVLNSMPVHVQERLRELAVSRDVPHVMFMASPDLDTQAFQSVFETLMTFYQSPAGARFFRDSRLQGLVEITDADMQALESFVEMIQLRRQ